MASSSEPQPSVIRGLLAVLVGFGLMAFLACSRSADSHAKEHAMTGSAGHAKIVFLHHSTGEVIWNGGLPQFIQGWNAAHGTQYEITEMNYSSALGGRTTLRRLLPERIFNKVVGGRYPWDNYPYDYWNLWVKHRGENRDRSELNLDDLARTYDVIVFKHCFPVSLVKADDGAADVSSPKKTLANYKLQYEALKQRMHEFPQVRFIVWTGAAQTQACSSPEEAERARQFTTWVKEVWDEPGDNIFVWDFHGLETEGGLYLKPEFASAPDDPHPTRALGAKAAPLLGQRIVDVIEGRGDQVSPKGR
ncbi:hypothetical protein GETHLI_33450 [Geothrix limicola]|uniref:SGNH/GDSL hydrolase family protein n=1 Tax=Geothrix limicola TaxID=2927978 RepID=A0ABQ5QJG9_9BACT|nr:hypothetical protein [Geothrix limicola]GLH74843.1 hypothetical protein GETHLI_33450 [Geothrix limicola]